MSKTVFVVDIDTTIANNDHRAELLQKTCTECGSPKPNAHHAPCPDCNKDTTSIIKQESWDHFLSPDLMALDKPVLAGIEAIHAMRASGMEIHFITGRSEIRPGMRDVTERWLKRWAGWDSSKEALIMRDGNHTDVAASIYKEDALRTLIKDKNLGGCSFIFFEDDPYVFRMYSKYGLVVKCPEAWEYFCPSHAVGAEDAWRR